MSLGLVELGLIELVHGESRATISSVRGGLTARFDVGTRHVLYLDAATFEDPAKNVRGGIPVLFPTPGKLADDHWKFAAYEGTQPQHGFARMEPWQVIGKDARSVTLRLDQPATPGWPWPCSLQIRYVLTGATLRLEPSVTNRGSTDMPFGLGFHPYFAVAQADKATMRIPTRARHAWDNVQKKAIELSSHIDLSQKEVDLHLEDHGGSRAQLVWADGKTVTLAACAELARWVIWTLADRDFVCLEPWTCPGNALNTGAQLLVLPPNETRDFWLDIVAG
ncbi:MAG: galactose mutarotase [Polyangia bacterium]